MLRFSSSLYGCILCAQGTKIGMGAGLLEESNKKGVGIATTVNLYHDIVDKLGLGATYTYGIPRKGSFKQIHLNAYYRLEFQRVLSARFSAGAATQGKGAIHPTFGFDWLVETGSSTEIFWGWHPVVRGHFRDPASGWSHTVTMGLLVKLH